MTLRRYLLLYIIILHVGCALIGGFLLWDTHRVWIMGLEIGLIVTFIVGLLLYQALRLPTDIVSVGMEWMKEGDFSHSFKKTGIRDVDRLSELYNMLIKRLRDERIRLEEQDIFLHKVMEASPSGIITVDHDGRIQQINPAAKRILDLSSKDLKGKRLSEIAIPLVHEISTIPMGSVRLLGSRGRARIRCAHSEFYDKGFPRSFYTLDDLTHEIWKSEKTAYESLIRTLSHEVNNTVGATNSVLQSALEIGKGYGQKDGTDLTTALQAAIERGEYLNSFMRRYAEVVRISSPVKKPVILEELIRDIIHRIEVECRGLNIEIELHLPEERLSVPVDIVQMEQVLVHIIRNAMEAIGSDGRIDITLMRRNGSPCIDIEDSGSGLSPEAKAGVFTPFFSTKNEGQGVGLTMVREILNMHGFTFELISEPGTPTRFTIDFGR